MSKFFCQKCGQELVHGSWPFCPHGKGNSAVRPDDIPGGLVMEHVEPGRKVYSVTELKKVLKDHRSETWPNGCRLSERGWRGHTDQHLRRWDAIPPIYSQEERRAQMAEHLGLTIEEYNRQFPA